MIEQVAQNAREISEKLSSRKIPQWHVSSVLGCGSTVIGMYSGESPFRKASRTTLYVLVMLNRHLDLILSESRRKAAISRFPSAESVLSFLGLETVSETVGVSTFTVKKWMKKIPDLWTPSQERRISVAALRIMAIIETESFRNAADPCQPELDLKEEPKQVLSACSKESLIIGLHSLADTLERIEPQKSSRKKISELLDNMREELRHELAVRRLQIEQELKALRALGL